MYSLRCKYLYNDVRAIVWILLTHIIQKRILHKHYNRIINRIGKLVAKHNITRQI